MDSNDLPDASTAVNANSLEDEGKDAPASPAVGASGGLGDWSNPNRNDMRLIRKAQRQRWGVTPAMLEKLPGIMNEIAQNPDAPVRDRVAATKTIVSMVGQDDGLDKETPPSAGASVNIYLPANSR